MDERVFIVIALVVILGLVAGLYFMLDHLGQRVVRLASEAKGREQNNVTNHQRLATELTSLIEQLAALRRDLELERVARSHSVAVERVAAKIAGREAAAELEPGERVPEDRSTAKLPPPPGEIPAGEGSTTEDEATHILSKEDMPSAPPPPTTALITPTRLSTDTQPKKKP